MKQENLKVTGMSCASCANRVEKVVKKLDGVEDANVNFATETLNVKFDTSKISDEAITNAIKKAGYGILKNLKTINVKIEGMSCASCANRLEKIIKKLDGVENDVVNFATEQLTVTLDEDKLSYNDIKTVVEKAGFKVAKETSSTNESLTNDTKNKQIKSLWNRFLISLIFTLPLLIISMGNETVATNLNKTIQICIEV